MFVDVKRVRKKKKGLGLEQKTLSNKGATREKEVSTPGNKGLVTHWADYLFSDVT